MGLMVHSLENIPETARRDYFIYLLDYGWKEPISDILRKNFDKMAYESAVNKAVIIKGLAEGVHFQNDVFSWHQINGIAGEEVLPALLISNQHPSYFRNHNHGNNWGKRLFNESEYNKEMKLIIIPFKKFCNTDTEVIELIQKIFKDIKGKKKLSEFAIAKEILGNNRNSVLDAVVLKPSIAGIGIDIKKLISAFFTNKK